MLGFFVEVIRSVESHKVAAAFLNRARGYAGIVPGGRVGSQRGRQPYYRTGWTALGMACVDVPHGPAV
jgi:hypothetical protein